MKKISNELRLEIAKCKGNNPGISLKELAEKFKVTVNQAYYAIKSFPEISKFTLNKTDENVFKKIALEKAFNPNLTIGRLAEMFNVSYSKARYALRKYGEYSDPVKILSQTKKSRHLLADFISDGADHIAFLKKQLNKCLTELDLNDNLSLTSRFDLLYRALRIKFYVQQLELESHLKKMDAKIIASIIKRFMPEASQEDIIKIYKEEQEKLKNDNEAF